VGDGGSEMKAGDFNAARNGASPRVVFVTMFSSPLSTAVKQLVFHVDNTSDNDFIAAKVRLRRRLESFCAVLAAECWR